jgi:MFS_1 like family
MFVSLQIPLFHLSGKIIAKLGVKACIALAQAAYVMRFLYYTVLTDPAWVLPSEVLHGFTFAIMYCAMVSALSYLLRLKRACVQCTPHIHPCVHAYVCMHIVYKLLRVNAVEH